MKRSIGFIALTTVLVLLAGCGTGTTNTANDGTGNQAGGFAGNVLQPQPPSTVHGHTDSTDTDLDGPNR